MKPLKLKAIFFIYAIVTINATTVFSENPKSTSLIAPDGTVVQINRDYFGVPHIKAESEIGVFFGQGFAAAQDRLAQMEELRRWAEGKQSEINGDGLLNSDKDARNMYYTEKERCQIFNELPDDFKTILASYCEGVNAYLDSMASEPAKYKPQQFAEIEMEPWTVNKSIAISQKVYRWFGQFGGEELIRLQELQRNGQAWLDENRPINDFNAPTTIPDGPAASIRQWRYSGIFVRDDIIESIINQQQQLKADAKKLGLPEKFGSFSVLISTGKSYSGNVMLLGCPQMGDPVKGSPQYNNEVELQCPTLHVAGMSIAGIPSVIIGHNEHHAWTLTSGFSDNCDVYIDSTLDNSYSKYYHNGEWLDFEVIQDTIISAGDTHYYTHYRTIHGPVISADLENNQVISLKMTFWKEEINMNRFLLGLARATNLAEFEAAAALNPFSFNLFYIGKDQNIKFWHIGKYQDRTDGIDPRLPHKGDGSEEWGGFIPFGNLPAAENPAQQFFVNWNNKPVSWWNHGDNVPWIGVHRVTSVDNYVRPIDHFTFDDLKNTPEELKSHGTYQQAIEFTVADIIDENIVPPGQSGFIDLNGQKSIHFDDQWQLHMFWKFKDQLFNYQPDGEVYPRIIFDYANVNLKTIFSDSAPIDTTFYIYNIGERADSIVISLDYDTADSSALSITPNSFELAVGDSQAIVYTIDPSILDEDRYNTKIIIDAKYCPSGFHYEKSINFKIDKVTGIYSKKNEFPEKFALEQICPNPFNASTTIQYSLPQSEKVVIKIFNLQGQKIETLIKEKQNPGTYRISWYPVNIPNGMYIVHFEAGDYVDFRKLILAR